MTLSHDEALLLAFRAQLGPGPLGTVLSQTTTQKNEEEK
jgi:hypothetical protein